MIDPGTIAAREKIKAALAKPVSDNEHHGDECFNPWEDVIDGIYGQYSSQSDALFIAALEAVRDNNTFDFIDEVGFAGELALYILAGHGFLEYGTSPRGGWWELGDHLLIRLISKWKRYANAEWGGRP